MLRLLRLPLLRGSSAVPASLVVLYLLLCSLPHPSAPFRPSIDPPAHLRSPNQQQHLFYSWSSSSRSNQETAAGSSWLLSGDGGGGDIEAGYDFKGTGEAAETAAATKDGTDVAELSDGGVGHDSAMWRWDDSLKVLFERATLAKSGLEELKVEDGWGKERGATKQRTTLSLNHRTPTTSATATRTLTTASEAPQHPAASSRLNSASTVSPRPWPLQFHAVLLQIRTGRLALTQLWYDWPGGRNLNAIRKQMQGGTLMDVEWNNGTSFYFNRHEGTCRRIAFPVGILTPDWLAGAALVDEGVLVDAQFRCRVWTKANFIQYYEDMETGLPVKWIFLRSGGVFHVLSFTTGVTLPNEQWQAPPMCFQ